MTDSAGLWVGSGPEMNCYRMNFHLQTLTIDFINCNCKHAIKLVVCESSRQPYVIELSLAVGYKVGGVTIYRLLILNNFFHSDL